MSYRNIANIYMFLFVIIIRIILLDPEQKVRCMSYSNTSSTIPWDRL